MDIDLVARRRIGESARPFGWQPYPLSGVARCAFEGAPLLGLRAGGRRLRYMRCSTAQRRGRAACQQPMIRAEVIEAQVAAYVSGVRLPPEYLGACLFILRRGPVII